MNDQWIFIDESGKPEVYSAKGLNLIESGQASKFLMKSSGLQVADYIASAVFQVYENNNRQWYEIVKNKIGKIQDVCNKKYFTRSNPL